MTLSTPVQGAEQHTPHPAFEQLYNSYWKLLYTTAFYKTGDHDDSVDLVQELFIHLWENWQTIHIQGSVKAYLLTSLRNRIFNHFRNKGVREKVKVDYARFVETLVSSKAAVVEDEGLRNLAEDAVQKAVEQLPEKMKYILVQNKYHQKSIQQLADELNIAPQTVKNQLTRALHCIENFLQQHHAKEISYLLLIYTVQLHV